MCIRCISKTTTCIIKYSTTKIFNPSTYLVKDNFNSIKKFSTSPLSLLILETKVKNIALMIVRFQVLVNAEILLMFWLNIYNLPR